MRNSRRAKVLRCPSLTESPNASDGLVASEEFVVFAVAAVAATDFFVGGEEFDGRCQLGWGIGACRGWVGWVSVVWVRLRQSVR